MVSDLEICRRIFRKYSWTYYYSTQMLPPDVRKRVWVLYAFFRLADEHVDNPVLEPAEQLRAFRDDVDFAWSRGTSREPVLRCFVRVARQHGIERPWVEAFLDSMEMDLTVSCYPRYSDLERYVYGSAEVVGLMMARVMRAPDAGLGHARLLGHAMQITNFLRDVAEDHARGRIYIPLEDLRRFGIDPSSWGPGVPERAVPHLQGPGERVAQQGQERPWGLPARAVEGCVCFLHGVTLGGC